MNSSVLQKRVATYRPIVAQVRLNWHGRTFAPHEVSRVVDALEAACPSNYMHMCADLGMDGYISKNVLLQLEGEREQ